MGRKYKKKKKALIDIVIPVHNRFDLLEKCLDALPDALRPHPYKVYIFDNASERLDADRFYVGRDIELTKNMQNIGFPQACNRAFRKGNAPLVFFLNSDVILEPDSIDKMVKVMDEEKVGVCGMKLVFPSHEDLITASMDMKIRPAKKLQHIGLVINIRGQVLHAFIGWDADHKRVNAVSDVWAVTGAALMTRRTLFREAGMFDEI
jgi:GT2 family glycosyltransferase